MAIDVLGIYGSSVASESWFLVGKEAITDVPIRLDTDIVEALVCLRSWRSLAVVCKHN